MDDPKQKVGSAHWWLVKLKKKLDERRKELLLLDDYYSGLHPLPFVTDSHKAKMRSEFKGLLEDSRSNFMELVVDAVDERLQVDGLRLSAGSDSQTDGDTWKSIWQQNNLDAEIPVAFLESLIKKVSYLSVWPKKKGGVTVAVEDPTQTIVGYVEGTNFRQRAAALKVYTDEWTGEERADVWMPDGIHSFKRARQNSGIVLPAGVGAGDWAEISDEFKANRLADVVPVVPIRNRSRLMREGVSEIESVTDTQDRINGQLFLRCLAGYFGAHRQRWAVGLKLYEDDAGNPVEPFDVAIDKLWAVEDDEVKFGEFDATDLAGYIKAIEQDVLHIAVTTRTPRHYLIEQGQSPSGDAIRSAESGLIKKVRRKMKPFGEGVEEALRIARRFNGQATPPDSQVVWADPEIRSDAERTDAVLKQYQAGLIPWETAMEKLGYDQTEIRRMDSQRQQDALLAPQKPGEPETVAV